MNRRDFMALANAIILHHLKGGEMFTLAQLNVLADVIAASNANFDKQRWLDYIHNLGVV